MCGMCEGAGAFLKCLSQERTGSKGKETGVSVCVGNEMNDESTEIICAAASNSEKERKCVCARENAGKEEEQQGV